MQQEPGIVHHRLHLLRGGVTETPMVSTELRVLRWDWEAGRLSSSCWSPPWLAVQLSRCHLAVWCGLAA